MEAILNGDDLTIKVKLEQGKPSSTGKSTVRYSSGGFQPVPKGNGLRVNVTAIEKKD